jgi:NADPH-dependent 2,4-dienoyl-CoA reductase/sulfur reductase-like enzyme
VLHRLRWPLSPLGTGLRLWGYANLSPAYRFLPVEQRSRIAWETLGPAGAWWLRDRVEGRVPVLVGRTVAAVEPNGSGVVVRVDGGGEEPSLTFDHVIAATGYRVDVDRLGFLDDDLRPKLRARNGSPVLSRWFESRVPGLFFVGATAAETFGPVMRFVCGADIAARRVADRLA